MSNIISPEDCQLGEFYAITINPDEDKILSLKNEFAASYVDELNDYPFKLWNYYMENSLKLLKYCDFKLFAEFSGLNRLHYHGFLKINSWEFFMFDSKLLQRIGIVKLDTIGGWKDKKKTEPYTQVDWYWYCTKNYFKFEHLFKKHQVYSFITSDNLLKKKKRKKNILDFSLLDS